MRKFLAILLSLAMVLALVPSVAFAADPVELAKWSIADGATTKSGIFSASMSDITSENTLAPSGGIRIGCAGWAQGEAFYFSTPTTGYDTITVSGEVRASKAGPASVRLQAKIADVWTDMGESIVIGNVGDTITRAFGPIDVTGVDNAATAELRLVVDTALAGRGGAIDSGGTLYIEDYITITGILSGGTTPPVTEPPADEPPATETAILMTTAPVTGDKVVIFNAEAGMALDACGTNGYYNAGVANTPVEGVMNGVTANMIWEVTANEDGTYYFSQEAGKLAMDVGFTSMSYDAVNDKWTLETVTGGYYIENVGRTDHKIQWRAGTYNYFSAYHTVAAGSEGAFTMSFYKVGATEEPPVTEPPATEPPADETVEIKLLGTSDIHGQFFATDYTAASTASGTYRRGLTRVATYIKEQRAAYDNIFVVDTGDLVQGTPLTYYYAFNQPTVDDPAMKALRTVGYDMFVPGNHEFNYGMTILQRQLNYLTSPATANESQVAVSAANYLAAATNNDNSKDWATWNGYAPYIVKEYDGVKVAVMGIANPNVPKWDVPANWEGIYFAGVLETYAHYEAEMQAAADIIVICSHSGINSDPGSDFIEELIQTTNTIDVAFAGHEHFNRVTEIANKDGEIVKVLSPYTKCRAIGDALLTYDKATGELTVAAEIKNMENYALDQELVDVLQPYEDATWADYMEEKIGEAAGPYSALNLGTAPSAFMDLINRVQLWGAYDRTGDNTENNPADDTMAQLSISAPLTSGSATELIPQGDITMGQMFTLYRYENWFYQITMTGKEVRTWLEFAATKIRTDAAGNPSVSSGDLTYYDVIYGDGFFYLIDYDEPEGQRIAQMTYNGVDVKDDDVFTVVVNNYRYNGGGNYVAYLNNNGCEFVANDPDRIIYSTQYDMKQGEDKGQARNLLADYIREMGIITPDITSTWKLQADNKYDYDYHVAGDEGYNTEYEYDEQGNLLWNVVLCQLGENELLSSLQFDVAWDKDQLEFAGVVMPKIYENDPLAGLNESIVVPRINTNADPVTDLAGASELYFALASARGAWVDEETNNVVMTLKFKIKDAVEDGTKIDLVLSNVRMSLVDKQEVDIDLTDASIGGYDGYIIVSRVDKEALIAEDAKDDAIMADEALVIAENSADLEPGTLWLTEAEKAANEAALAASQAVIDDLAATQEEVDAALAALQAAFVAPHVTVVDKTELIAEDAKDDAIMADEALVIAENSADLEPGTLWLTEAEKAANEAALAAAQAVIDDATATQNEVDAALAALQAAFVAPHVTVVDKTDLIAEDAKDDAIMANPALATSTNGFDLAEGTLWLTEAEKAANEAALAAAQAVIDDATATQNEVDAALAALQAAFVAPHVATINTTALEAAIAAAEAAKADKEGWNDHGDDWRENVEAALAAAEAALEAKDSQNAVDQATADLLAALGKTGESTTFVVYIGIAVLAMLGLAVVVKRRFN